MLVVVGADDVPVDVDVDVPVDAGASSLLILVESSWARAWRALMALLVCVETERRGVDE